ncbi:MAG: twin-arginine translocation signal domain-containing protein, partial [Planctomycetota bacterium]
MHNKAGRQKSELSRRDFIKTSAALGAAAWATGTSRMYAAGSDKIRLGLIGCGGRGTHDMTNCLKAAENVELVAMGDVFKDRLD